MPLRGGRQAGERAGGRAGGLSVRWTPYTLNSEPSLYGGAMAGRTSELFSVRGRAAIVTGAASGIGKRFAALLVREGAHVAAADLNEAALREAVAEMNEAAANEGAGEGKAVAKPLDVTAPESVIAAFVDEAWEEFGGIDILVNCAGIYRGASVLEESEADWEASLRVNAVGPWKVARAVARLQAAGGRGGAIASVASTVGQPGGCMPDMAAYATSKAAVQQLTRNLALELGPYGIRVNTISPGFFVTGMTGSFASVVEPFYNASTPLRRIGDLDRDLDGALLLLVSDAGAYITGADITVDGGLRLAQMHPIL